MTEIFMPIEYNALFSPSQLSIYFHSLIILDAQGTIRLSRFSINTKVHLYSSAWQYFFSVVE